MPIPGSALFPGGNTLLKQWHQLILQLSERNLAAVISVIEQLPLMPFKSCLAAAKEIWKKKSLVQSLEFQSEFSVPWRCISITVCFSWGLKGREIRLGQVHSLLMEMWLKKGQQKGFGFHLYLFLELVSCTGSVGLGKHKRPVKYFTTLIAAKEKTPRMKKNKTRVRRITALKILIKINPTRPLKPFWLQLVCFDVSNTKSCSHGRQEKRWPLSGQEGAGVQESSQRPLKNR